MGANRTSTKISDHLGCIYDLLNNLQTQINNEVNARKSDVNDARAKANAAQATANSKADRNHNHDNSYAKKNHYHKVNYAMAHVVIDGKKSTAQFVSGLMTGGSYTTNTSNEV